MNEEKRLDKSTIQKRLDKNAIQKLLIIVSVVLCLVMIWNMNQSINRLQQELSMLHQEVNGLSGSISSEIGNISYNIDSSLKKENSIIADYSYQVQADKINKKEKTIPLSLMVRPKEHKEGLKTTFILETQNGKTITAPGKEGEANTYTASIVVPLSMSDYIKLSVSFDDGAVQRSEKLEEIYQVFDRFIMKVDSTASFRSTLNKFDAKRKLVFNGTVDTSITANADGSNYPVSGEVQIIKNESVIQKLPIPIAQETASDYGNGEPMPEAAIPLDGYTTYYTQLNETVILEGNDVLKINVIVKDNFGYKYKQTIYSERIDKDGNSIPADYSGEVEIE